MDIELKTVNPDNKYDDGTRTRYWLVASEDDLVVNLIGRGVFCGFHTVIPGSVQRANQDMVGERDGIFMLDGGGHAWMHEVDDYDQERSEKAYEKFIGNRRVAKVQPQHEVTVEI